VSFDPNVAALVAVAGDRDDTHTIIAWMLALNGRLNTISDLAAPFGDRVQLARAWDGLDGREVCDAMEAAFDALGLYEKALEVAA
jgi:hypothetical protein